jgi:hypothetical protein
MDQIGSWIKSQSSIVNSTREQKTVQMDLTNINACSQVLVAGEWLHLRTLSLTKMTLSGQRQYLCHRGHAPLRRTPSWLLKMTESYKFAGYRK